MPFNPIIAFLLSNALLIKAITACGLPYAGDLQDLSSFASSNRGALAKRHSVYHSPQKIALDNVRVFDGHKLTRPTTVIIDGTFIGTDATNAKHIDGRGAVLLPGFIDAHIHPMNVSDLESLAKNGVTTGYVMACYSAEMCTSLGGKGNDGLPSLLFSSAPASAPNSAHGNITARVDPSLGSILINSTSEVPTWTHRQLASNPDYFKLVAETPGLSQNTLTSLVKAARRVGKPTITHASMFEAYGQAILAKSDHIHHAPLDKPIGASMIKAILRNRQVVTPTLTMMRTTAKNNARKYNFRASLETVRSLHKAGVPILTGTDANLAPGVPAGVSFGTSIHDEMENLVEAGMSNAEALRAATNLPAKYFGLRDRGVIRPGMRADLVLVEGDPVADIKATRKIKKVWIGGVELSGV
ncbi:uncharacterized protein EI97DRAFT_426744 [Westerdykella ornata]|uniref:Amidohydrolase-related domain-containing protein n=1 Tax=Westerdykella ornata TaxID=318751 RepID=A0A6A6J7M9_WESOR|nr:uncharacterized protein EI97DRAFT_426744 [Westerdykella ornata]KAF2272227.1 hypothetical protein EI97DRAFT_426744 [Westerdykella ornata]